MATVKHWPHLMSVFVVTEDEDDNIYEQCISLHPAFCSVCLNVTCHVKKGLMRPQIKNDHFKDYFMSYLKAFYR